MSTVTNPLASVVEGMLQGHALAMQMKRAADEHQAFLTNQMIHNQEMSFNDAQRTAQLMASGARPVVNGMVQEPTSTVPGMQPMLGAEGLPTPGPQQVQGILRKPGGNGRFTVTLADAQGNKRQYEMPSPEEQLARQTQMMASAELAKQLGSAQAAEQVRQTMLAREGIVLDPRIGSILGYPAGTKVLQNEIPGLLQEAQKIRTADQYTLAPGAVRVENAPIVGGPQPGQPGQVQPQTDTWLQSLQKLGGGSMGPAPITPGTAPTGPQVIATGGPPLATDDFGKYFLPKFLLKIGKTPANATVDDITAAKTAFDKIPKSIPTTSTELAMASVDPSKTPAERALAEAALKKMATDKINITLAGAQGRQDIANPARSPEEIQYWKGQVQRDAKNWALIQGNKGLANDVRLALTKDGVNMNQLDAQTRDSARFASTLMPHITQIQQDIASLDAAGKLGPIASRWGDFMAGKVGAGDPAYERLRVQMGLFKTALGRVHGGSRGGASPIMLKHFDSLINSGTMDANTLRSGIDAAADWVKGYAQMGEGATPMPAAAGPVPGGRPPLSSFEGK